MASAHIVPVTTAADGTAQVDVRIYGVIEAIAFRLGSLVSPHFTITDQLSGGAILAVTDVLADVRYQPRVPVQDATGNAIANAYDKPSVTGTCRVAVTNGGNKKSGAVIILFDSE